MVNITNAEQWALNVLGNAINLAQDELQRALAAKEAYIKLLESKYDAEFGPESGEFKPKEKEKQ